jgi:hypothetical protein
MAKNSLVRGKKGVNWISLARLTNSLLSERAFSLARLAGGTVPLIRGHCGLLCSLLTGYIR